MILNWRMLEMIFKNQRNVTRSPLKQCQYVQFIWTVISLYSSHVTDVCSSVSFVNRKRPVQIGKHRGSIKNHLIVRVPFSSYWLEEKAGQSLLLIVHSRASLGTQPDDRGPRVLGDDIDGLENCSVILLPQEINNIMSSMPCWRREVYSHVLPF